MPFEFRDNWLNDYTRDGYLVFPRILPTSLVRDLRRECDKARSLAHELHGPLAQRLQPVERYADKLDLQPFKDYCELLELRGAVERLLGPSTHGHLHIMGILVEPKDHPWNLGWHRDGMVEVPLAAQDEILRAKLVEIWHDLSHYNQVNCAIYADSCTWYVPGSHLRQFDLPGERQTIGELTEKLKGLSGAEAERVGYEHCESFPGAVQIHLQPGDYMVYRNLGWHNGNYTPTQPRATLHDIVLSKNPGPWSGWGEAKLAAVARMEARQMVDQSAREGESSVRKVEPAPN